MGLRLGRECVGHDQHGNGVHHVCSDGIDGHCLEDGFRVAAAIDPAQCRQQERRKSTPKTSNRDGIGCSRRDRKTATAMFAQCRELLAGVKCPPPNKEDGDAYQGKWHESHTCAEEHDIERLTHMLGRVRVRNDTKDIGHESQARANDQCSDSIQLFSQANKSIPAQRRGVINADWKCPQGNGQNNDMKDRSSMKPPVVTRLMPPALRRNITLTFARGIRENSLYQSSNETPYTSWKDSYLARHPERQEAPLACVPAQALEQTHSGQSAGEAPTSQAPRAAPMAGESAVVATDTALRDALGWNEDLRLAACI
ncbi:hypothetical protein CCUS01_08576 [Colletotrichum cuscutae]|uniref:Uncharacterized protein n=1 Tax=Colletotrichum cuscutae TaxID=1209917 RepID=A0AAI9XWV1_9PEZI|nr:hypothetical protein CCUS01_08576 [Colletotrichum cuscutae]